MKKESILNNVCLLHLGLNQTLIKYIISTKQDKTFTKHILHVQFNL